MKNLKSLLIGIVVAGTAVGALSSCKNEQAEMYKAKVEEVTQERNSVIVALTNEKIQLERETQILLERERNVTERYNSSLSENESLKSRNRFLQTEYEKALTSGENLRAYINALEHRLNE